MPERARLQGAARLGEAFGQSHEAVSVAGARTARAVVLDGEFQHRPVERLTAHLLDRAAAGAAVPYDVGDGLAQRPRQGGLALLGHTVEARLGGQFGGDAGRGQGDPGTGALGVQAGTAVAGDGLPYVDEGLAADLLDVGDLLGRLVGAVGQHPPGQLALQRDQGQRVAEQVVQVPGQAQALLVGGELGGFGGAGGGSAWCPDCRMTGVMPVR